MSDATTPWAAPGAEIPAPPPAAIAPVELTERESTPKSLPPFPTTVGPMTVADVLDGAFEIMRRRPREMAMIAAATILPLQILLTVVFREYFASDIFSLSAGGSGVDEVGSEPTVGQMLAVRSMSAIGLAWTCGAVSVLVADWYRGISRSVPRILVHVAKVAPALAVGVVVAKVVEGLSFFFFFLPFLVALAAVHVMSPVIALEKANPFTALTRSARLALSQRWRSLVLPLATALVGLATGTVFGVLTEFLAELTPIEYAWVVVGAGQLVANMVVIPFTAGVAALFYLDLRIRSEGLDLEERARVLLGR